MWIDYVFPGTAITNNYRWHNYTLTITDPNGNKTTKNWDAIMDTTSNQGYSFAPAIVGTYKLEFSFAGQNYTQYDYSGASTSVGDIFLPSNATSYLTVVDTPTVSYPYSYPLPTEYWTRPIYGENTYWWTISSNWLGNGAPGYGGLTTGLYSGGTYYRLPTDSIGPMTPHIMWTKELQSGGVVGGAGNYDPNFGGGGNTFFEGSAYQMRFNNPIIVAGKLVYNGQSGYLASSYHTYCVDLRTGAVLVDSATALTLSFAYIPDFENGNQHGVVDPLLCTANFAAAYDLSTLAAVSFSPSGIPSGTLVQGPNGEPEKYILSSTTISLWNSTKMWTAGNSPGSPSGSQASSAAKDDFYNVPLMYQGNTFTSVGSPTVVDAIYGDCLVASNGTLPTTGASSFIGTTPNFNQYTYFGVNLNASRPGYNLGDVMWIKNINPPVDNTGSNVTVLRAGIDPVNHVFVENFRETNEFVGYSMLTGAQLWHTSGMGALDYYGSQSSGTITNAFAFGNMYVSAYDGIVYCYDCKTGKVTWTYGNGGPGNSTDGGAGVGRYPTFVSAFDRRGAVYTITSEHTIETPIYKGAMARCLNASTGAEIWKLDSYTGEFFNTAYAVADGYAVWLNGIDNRIYSVGQGPSQTTVSAPQAGITLGNSMIISGSVIDTSAGTKGPEQIARFPAGVPAVSDSCMSDYMGYIYQQKPLPDNFTGVPVQLIALDSNGNYQIIGTPTTDKSGTYSIAWTPNIQGKYTIYAQFAGTQGNFPSNAETSCVVDAPAATAAPVVTPPPTVTEQYFLPSVAGIIAAIAVVGIVLAMLSLKKRA